MIFSIWRVFLAKWEYQPPTLMASLRMAMSAATASRASGQPGAPRPRLDLSPGP
jgi:hypothetical protein